MHFKATLLLKVSISLSLTETNARRRSITNERLANCTMQICQNVSSRHGEIFTLTCGTARQPITLYKTLSFTGPYRFIASHLAWAGHSAITVIWHTDRKWQKRYLPGSIPSLDYFNVQRFGCRGAGKVSCFECKERWHQGTNYTGFMDKSLREVTNTRCEPFEVTFSKQTAVRETL